MDKKKILHIVNTFRVKHTQLMKILLTYKRKGDPQSRTLSRTSDTTETRNPCVMKVILLAFSTYIDIF